jgi:alpha-glucosidase
MQWDASKYAGFGTAKPWLTSPESFKTHNVAEESKEPQSLLNFYKSLIKLRRDEPFKSGKYEPINTTDANVLAYLRKDDSGTVLVALNFSDKEQEFKPQLGASGASGTFSKAKSKVLLQSDGKDWYQGNDTLIMHPFGVFVAKVSN